MFSANYWRKLLQEPDSETESERQGVYHLSEEPRQIPKVLLCVIKCQNTKNKTKVESGICLTGRALAELSEQSQWKKFLSSAMVLSPVRLLR